MEKENNESINVYDLAAYIIDFYLKQEKNITNLKLQKIMYYSYVNYIKNALKISNDESNILNLSSPISAWRYGPVIKEIYNVYKGYGAESIKQVLKHEFIKFNSSEFTIATINPNPKSIEEEELLKTSTDDILNDTMNIDEFTLVRSTHKETPWFLTKGLKDDVIKKELLIEFAKNGEFKYAK